MVVYASRSLQLPKGEPPLGVQPAPQTQTSPPQNALGATTLVVTYTTGNVSTKPNLRKGDWVLDASTNQYGTVNGYFYRLDSVTDSGAGQLTLQLETPLKQPVTTLLSMENVITVLDRGVGWKP